jgi:hemoglobin/transferrin/lactoferrin receptor protein
MENKGGLFVMIAACAAISVAQERPDSTQELERMTVTATRTSRRSIETPNSISILSAQQMQMEDMARTVPEALGNVSGIMVQRTSHGQGSPYIRGFTSQRTLFLIDGIRLNNSVFREGPNQYWSTVDLLSLDKLEVMKGPASVLYGSYAIGGTVNAITSRPVSGRLGFISPRLYYRFSEAEQSHVARLEASGNLPGNISYTGGFSPKHFGDLKSGGAIGAQKKTGYNELDGDVRLESALSGSDRLVAAYQRVSIPDAWRTHSTVYGIKWKGTQTGSDQIRTFDQNRQLAYLTYSGTQKWGWAEKISLKASYHKQIEDEYQLKKDTSSMNQGFNVQTIDAGGQLDARNPAGLFSLGVDLYRDYVGSFRNDFAKNGSLKNSYVQGPVADDATYDEGGVFLQDDYSIGRFNAIAGIRYSHFKVKTDKVYNPVTKTTMSVRKSWDNVVGSFRAIYEAVDNDRLNIFSGIGQGFRAPNLSDLTRFDMERVREFEVPSPNLKPEQFVTGEIGVKSDNTFIGGSLAYFYTDIRSMIIRTPTGVTRGAAEAVEYEITKKNSGKGYVHGLETELRTELFSQFELEGVLTVMYGEVDGYPTSQAQAVAEPMSRLMPPTGHMSLTWKPPALPVRLSVSGSAAAMQDRLSSNDIRDTQRIPPGGTPSYYFFNFGAGWQPFKDVEVSLRVSNLLNRDYRIHGSGLNEAGRSLMLAVNLKY